MPNEALQSVHHHPLSLDPQTGTLSLPSQTTHRSVLVAEWQLLHWDFLILQTMINIGLQLWSP